ncbi:hypothetical protein QFZ96_002449 [Paraburkholderia youngii]|uniref:hypothetical protein n=1 Tax=Paraburkholderia youngii TaxID=2782701 RepID=UPI003D1C4A20
MSSGNPTGLNIGDSVWLVPGSKTTLYSSVPVNVDVLLPVVQTLASSTEAIVGFAAFHIDASVGGSGKYERWPRSFGQFSEIYKWNVRGNHAADLIAGSVAKYASSGVRSARLE